MTTDETQNLYRADQTGPESSRCEGQTAIKHQNSQQTKTKQRTNQDGGLLKWRLSPVPDHQLHTFSNLTKRRRAPSRPCKGCKSSHGR